jgi:hypothetical protein
MADDGKLGIDLKGFGASFKGFMDQMAQQAPDVEPELLRRAREHFGQHPATLPVVAEEFARHEHPNLHLAIEAYLGGRERSADLLGVTVAFQMFGGMKLSQLFSPGSGVMKGSDAAQVGPVEYNNVSLDDGRVLACVSTGLYFVREGERRLAVLVTAPSERPFGSGPTVQVMAADRAQAEAVLAELRNTMRARSVYRGRVISLEGGRSDGVDVKFHHLPKIERDGIILPAGTLDRIERQTVRFAELKDHLVRMGRHVKRGVLLYGLPGTGKTLTAMYLASRMPDRTVLLLTGRTLGLIEQSCAMARLLQPATVILEDVDLVAEERTHQGVGCNPVLFELLNQMDGLADDADVLFLLTTNRPDILEPALASRPGRIDQAIEIPLPDEECRARLLELYGRGLSPQALDGQRLVARTKGVSAAFMRELLRRAALFAADEGLRAVADKHIDVALQELVVEGGKLTHSLLGASGLAPAGFAQPRRPD